MTNTGIVPHIRFRFLRAKQQKAVHYLNPAIAFPTNPASYIHLQPLGKQKLRITGSGLDSKSVTTPPARKQGFGRTARVLPKKYFPLLDKALLNALGELSLNGDLKALPMTITKVETKVLLTKVESDTTLIFESTTDKKQTSILYKELALEDQALLSRLVARIRPNDKEAQAYAGVFMERTGDTKTADQYFQKSGTELHQQIEGLFE